MEKNISTELILSKFKQYQFELIFLIFILIFAGVLKTLFNFILDYKIIIILIFILWYLGYLNNIQNTIRTKLNYITFK